MANQMDRIMDYPNLTPEREARLIDIAKRYSDNINKTRQGKSDLKAVEKERSKRFNSEGIFKARKARDTRKYTRRQYMGIVGG